MNERASDAGMESTPALADVVSIDVSERDRARIASQTGAARGAARDDIGDVRGVTWMRISDAVAMGSGKVAGRGLSLEAALAHRIRRQPAVTRRAIRERAHRLPPLPSFGVNRRTHGRDAMDRG
jgi:hypothetical protein